MTRALLAVATVVAALLMTATANAALAKANQFEGVVNANGCSAARPVTTHGPGRIDVLFAGTNAGGFLFGQILGPNGAVLSNTGSYTTTTGGTYAVRVCFLGDDEIDASQVAYVGSIVAH